MNKHRLNLIWNAITALSSFGFIAVIITFHTKAGVLILTMFGWITTPILIGYLITLVLILFQWIRKGYSANKLNILIHALPLLLIVISIGVNSELFKSKEILRAYLKDDLSGIEIVLRKNGKFENTSIGMFCITETFKGKYEINGDTIVFLNKPYSNDFLSDRMLIRLDKNKIYYRINEDGTFYIDDSFLNYFEITHNGFSQD